MMTFEELSKQMNNLKKQIDKIICQTKYKEDTGLSNLDDFNEINSSDDKQMLEEYGLILYKLSEIQNVLAYYNCPIKELGTLHLNSQGRYETESGYYYTSGQMIEFLRTEEIYNSDSYKWKETEIWTTSRVESKYGTYYIVHYDDIDMEGLKVRIR